MNEICTFPIDRRWPADHPDRIQLYATPGGPGLAISIMLEETGLPYELHIVDGSVDENDLPGLESLNPEGGTFAIIDPDGPDDAPLLLGAPGAILLYLAEKTGKLMPTALSACYQTLEWVFLQQSLLASGAGISSGGGSEASLRLLDRVESRLRDRDWIMEEGYSIADIAILERVRHAAVSCDLGKGSGLQSLSRLADWMERCLARPAVQRSIKSFDCAPVAPVGAKPASGMPAF